MQDTNNGTQNDDCDGTGEGIPRAEVFWVADTEYVQYMRNMVQRILQCADAQGTHQNGVRGGAKFYSILTKNRKNIKHVGNVLFRPLK